MTKVLLVEDDEMVRDMLSRRLASRGYEMSTAADGAEGHVRALGEHPDLILLDLRMPKVDGWQLLEWLKTDERTRTIPVIALTAHALAGDRDRCMALGCNDYVTKPVDLPRLLAKMAALIAPVAPP